MAAERDAEYVAKQTIALARCPDCKAASDVTAQFKRDGLKFALLIAIVLSVLIIGLVWIYSIFRDDAMSPRSAALGCGVLACIFFSVALLNFRRPLHGISSRVKWLPQ